MEKMEELKYNFDLTFAEILLVLKGLQELPFKESNGLIKYFQDAYYKQQRELELKAKADKEAEATATTKKTSVK